MAIYSPPQRGPHTIIKNPSLLSDAAIPRFYAVIQGTDANHCAVVSSAITNVPLGICDTGAVQANQQCDIVCFGETMGVSHDTGITAGALLTTYSDGTLQAAQQYAYPFAIALETPAAAGVAFRIFVFFPTVAHA